MYDYVPVLKGQNSKKCTQLKLEVIQSLVILRGRTNSYVNNGHGHWKNDQITPFALAA
jgi:hypothetical protein